MSLKTSENCHKGITLRKAVFPFVIFYWGSGGGGLRFAREAIIEIVLTTNDQILTSIKPDLIKDLIEKFPNRIINFDPNLPTKKFLITTNAFMRIKTRKAFRKFVFKNEADRILIVMSHPWDISLSRSLGKSIGIYRVIHDLRRHSGDFWPNGRTIQRMKKDQVLIALSEHIYTELPKEKTIQASLARLEPSVTPIKPVEIDDQENGFILIVGRNKRYQRQREAVELVSKVTEEMIVTTANLPRKLTSNPKVINIKRWLTDSELEYLISHAGVLVCLYREASQSGIVEQAKYWGIPIVVSNRGALPEQIMNRNNCFILTSGSSFELKAILQSALTQSNLRKNYKRQKTLVQAVSEHYFEFESSKY